MKVATILIAGVTLLAACSHTETTRNQNDPSARGTGYLEDGPTVKIDSAPSGRTTLQELDQLSREATLLKQKLRDAEQARQEADARAQTADIAQGDLARRNQELEELLGRQAEENKDLMDQLLKARLAKLRMERQMIQSRIADLVDDGK
ncbi:MAG: hypothetical protein CMJ83_11170 [Planctomycetes bacterium]|nr:hypothetical protein [Planctomycetota bacterium]